MNTILIVAGFMVVILILYFIFFRKKKTFCTVTIYDYLKNNNLIKHEGTYNCHIESLRNASNDKTIYWSVISNGKKNYIWRTIQNNELISTNNGGKHINLARIGINDFKVINPVYEEFKYVKSDTPNYYIKEKKQNISMEIMNEEDQYFTAEIYDRLDEIYAKKESILDKLKPYLTIAVIGMICLMFMAITYNTSKDIYYKSIDENKESRNFLQNAVDKLTTKQVDNNTIKVQSGTVTNQDIINGGKNG